VLVSGPEIMGDPDAHAFTKRRTREATMLRRIAIGLVLVVLGLTSCRYIAYTETKDEYVFRADSFKPMSDPPKKAREHCAKYNRVPRLVSRNRMDNMYHFQCVDP